MRSWGWVLIQDAWSPYRRGVSDTGTEDAQGGAEEPMWVNRSIPGLKNWKGHLGVPLPALVNEETEAKRG